MATFGYITIEEAIHIHALTVENSGGGALGHFNLGRLESVLDNIQNDDYYPTLSSKITHLFHSTCQFHCFEDGNKRVAIALAAEFLLKNGYMAVAKTFFAEMENISYHVAAGKISKELLFRIMDSILRGCFNGDEGLRLEIYNSIK